MKCFTEMTEVEQIASLVTDELGACGPRSLREVQSYVLEQLPNKLTDKKTREGALERDRVRELVVEVMTAMHNQEIIETYEMFGGSHAIDPSFDMGERRNHELVWPAPKQVKKEPETNIEFLNNLMEYSKTGALMQLFVMTAIEKYGAMIEACDEEDWNTNFISLEGWKCCAVEIREKLAARL